MVLRVSVLLACIMLQMSLEGHVKLQQYRKMFVLCAKCKLVRLGIITIVAVGRTEMTDSSEVTFNYAMKFCLTETCSCALKESFRSAAAACVSF